MAIGTWNTGQFVVVIASAMLFAALVCWQYAEWEQRHESWADAQVALGRARAQAATTAQVNAIMNGRSVEAADAARDSVLLLAYRDIQVLADGRLRYLAQRKVWRPIVLICVFGVVPAISLAVSWRWFSARNRRPAEASGP